MRAVDIDVCNKNMQFQKVFSLIVWFPTYNNLQATKVAFQLAHREEDNSYSRLANSNALYKTVTIAQYKRKCDHCELIWPSHTGCFKYRIRLNWLETIFIRSTFRKLLYVKNIIFYIKGEYSVK